MKFYEAGAQGMKEMEELSKIKYSIGELLKRREDA